MVREITFSNALNEAISEEMEKDKNVILIGQEVGIGYEGIYGVSTGLMKKFGSRQIIDTPIIENTMLGCGIGSALLGMKPIVEIMFSDFSTVCFDGIVNQIAKIKYMSGDQYSLNIVLRMSGGGGWGMGPHHSQCFESIYMGVPGLKIVAPSNGYDAKGLLKSSINDGDPIIFIENRKLYKTKSYVPNEEYTIPIGKGRIVREGSDLTIIALSYMVNIVEKVADSLKVNNNISVEIVDPRSVVPLDEEIIFNSIKKTNRVAIIEEGHLRSGIGSEVSAIIAQNYMDYLDHPILRIGAKNIPIPASISLEKATIPNSESVYSEICSYFHL